jgi:hypothetical protein
VTGPPNEALFPILVRSRWGFIDRAGRVVVRPQFESTVAVEAEREGSSRAGKENTDELFMAPSVVAETTAIVAVKSAGNWGFLDQRGELLPLRFDEVGPFREGLAPVRQGLRWGFVGTAGTIAVPVMFDQVDAFHGGVAIVSQESRFGVVDPEGRFVVKPRFEAIRPADSVFYDNRALFTLFDKKGYASRAGNIAVPPRFDSALPFSEGLAAVTRGDETGYIDTTGRMVIAPRWWTGSRFSRGRAVVIVGTQCGYIDRSGAFVAKPQFTDARPFTAEDRALAWKGPVKGWVDLSGRWTPTRIDELQRLDDSLSVVAIEGRTWLMRRATEQTIREYPWQELGPFREGLALVRGPDRRFGFIDTQGRVVIPVRFTQAADFDHGLCKAATRDTLGYLDRTGAWVWSSRFR